MNQRRRLLALLAAVPLAQAATLLPDLGDGLDGDQEALVEASRRSARALYQSPAYLDEPLLQAYGEKMLQRLVQVAPRQMAIKLLFLDVGQINAFAMPSGHVVVFSGLMLAARTEAEWLGVLAHELAHVYQRHSVRAASEASRVGLATMLAALAGGAMAGRLDAGVITGMAGLQEAGLRYSREFEREADRMGFELLDKAGFDASGMSSMFENLAKLQPEALDRTRASYTRTHPLSAERQSDMQARLDARTTAAPLPSSLDSLWFAWVQAFLWLQQGQDGIERALGQPQPKAIERYLRLEQALRQNRSRTQTEALAAELIAAGPHPLTRQIAASVWLKYNLPELALAQMTNYEDRLSRIYRAQALSAMGRYQASEKLVRSIQPSNAYLWKLNHRNYQGLDKPALRDWAWAEAKWLEEDPQGALSALERARKQSGADFFERSIMDARYNSWVEMSKR